MNERIYVAADVHTQVTVFEAQTASGRVFSQGAVPTRPEPLKSIVAGLPGEVYVTFEEGTHAAWLYELYRPLVAKVVVCNPRHNALLKSGDKDDRTDPAKLCELFRLGSLRPVYHSLGSFRELEELAASRASLVTDRTRCKNRVRAVFRSRGIWTKEGPSFYALANRDYWLKALADCPGKLARADRLFKQLDGLNELVAEAEGEFVQEARRYAAFRIIKSMPRLGKVRSAQVLAKVKTPFRFRSKRPFWRYCGLAVVHKRSSEYQVTEAGIVRQKKSGYTRGLNRDRSPLLKKIFKSAAAEAASHEFAPFIEERLDRGMSEDMAKLTLARKLAAITLAIWKKGERFDLNKALMSH